MLELLPHEERVIKMMRGFGQNTPDSPVMPSPADRSRCFRLLLEEVLEYGAAAGFEAVTHSGDGQTLHIDDLAIMPTEWEPALDQMVDACADISVVNTGAFAAMGVRMKAILELVDANNLLKIETGSLNPESGKFIKHPDHPKPDFAAAIQEQRGV